MPTIAARRTNALAGHPRYAGGRDRRRPLRPGAKLPTEAELARPIGVNRHTVRRALAVLAEAGRIHVRRGADSAERHHLRLPKGAQVHVTESISQADGIPVIYSRTAFPAARLPGLPEALGEAPSITAALARCGITDYQRLWTRLTAERPSAMIARHLRMPETSPVLRSESLDIDAAGHSVEYGIAWFCSERVQLVVDRTSFL